MLLNWAVQTQDLLGIFAQVLVAGVEVSWSPCHKQEKMVFLLWQGWVSLCSWLELDLYTCPSLLGPFHTVSSGWVWDICRTLLIFHYFVGGMVPKICVQFPTVGVLYSLTGSSNSVPLSDSMYLGHIWTGRYWLMKVDTMVSADLSGIWNASGHPVRWSMFVAWTWGFTFCDQIYGNLVKRACWNLCHLEWISLNLGFFSVILLSNKSALTLGVLVYHVLLPIPCISMPWGLQEPRIFSVSLWCLCKAVLLCVQKHQPHV